MINSKFLRLPSYALKCSARTTKHPFSSLHPPLINPSVKTLSSCFYFYDKSCQYSTSLTGKRVNPKINHLKSLSLNLTACLSTDGSKDSYQVVFTNPAEGTTNSVSTTLSSLDSIKQPDVLSTETADAALSVSDQLSSLAELVEPPLSSLGLGSPYTPVGWIQMFLEYMHVNYHCPWWIAIVACTVVARILLLPLLLKTQRNALQMSNLMPQLQYLQAKFGEARRTGNSMEANRYANEMMIFMKEKNVSPVKNAILPLLQAPVFISFFFALRNMAVAPVESMKDGGIWWVTDLTIPDPYYLLPLTACSTLYVVLKVGAESGVRLDNMKLAKYFISALPVIALPFTINFPSAILYYWVTNNFMTLLIVSILKIKPIRQYFNLPTQQPINPKFKLPDKGFFKGIKDAYEDQKVLATVEDRRRMDNIRFQKAGTGPIPRTYSYDPTKPRPSNVASLAKNVAARERKN